jgi:hypothetical protein
VVDRFPAVGKRADTMTLAKLPIQYLASEPPMNEVKPEDLAGYLRGRMSLIIGPDITKFPQSFTAISNQMAKQADVIALPRFIDTSEELIAKGLLPVSVQKTVNEIIGSQPSSSVLVQLAKVRWAAVLSFSLDSHFDDCFRQERDRRAMWPQIAVLRTLTEPLPPKAIPLFKLMGISTDQTCAYSAAEYTIRKALWRDAAKIFRDYTKANPVLCIGLSDASWAFMDFISDMIAVRAMPKTLLLLADDPLLNNTTVRSVLGSRCTLLKVRGTINDVVRITAEAEKFSYSPLLQLTDPTDDALTHVRQFYNDLVTPVNDHLVSKLTIKEINQLRDLLFSPSVARWDPFVLDLDFPRTCCIDLLERINEYFATPSRQSTSCIISGSSVTGKTILLKRLSLNLAKAGILTLWLKPSSFQDSPKAARDLFTEVEKIESHYGRKIAVFMDDPLSFGSLSPKDITAAAQLANVQILLVVGSRTTDQVILDRREHVGGLPLGIQCDLLDNLDDDEWERLPGYLVTLGVAADKNAANALIVGSNTTRDTLSMLYWLLPGTQVAIGSSLREEYHRLGDVAGLSRVIKGTYEQGSAALKACYEMVAVAAFYNASVPLEVLVNALGISFTEWTDATGGASALWGLIYEDTTIDEETVYYRTRNSIVTNLIVETINGGALVRTGEMRVLSTLLQACNGATPIYREFCVRLLVPERKLTRLMCEEGVLLYTTARNALPYPDKTLMHHHALWVKNKCNNPALAAEILNEALVTPVYPYAQRGESDGHIHTSLAATTLDGVDNGQISLEDGKLMILEHLDRAREIDFFDPKAVHVQANLVCRLADKVDSGPDYLATVNRALADVDHTLMMLQSQVMQNPAAAGSIQALQEIKDKVFVRVKDIDELKAEADRVWSQFSSQEGFILAARKLYANALEKGKRFDITNSYCMHAMETIEKSNAVISPGLRKVFAQNFYQWRVHRRHMSEGPADIPWDVLRDNCAAILANAGRLPDPLFRHVYALSLAHLGQWVEANSIYTQMRQSGMPFHILFTPRDFLLNPRGGLKTVQGTIRFGAKDKFLYCPELGTDFLCDKKCYWPNKDEEAFAVIQFSFAGPMAIEPFAPAA